jgi:hypothetical protein
MDLHVVGLYMMLSLIYSMVGGKIEPADVWYFNISHSQYFKFYYPPESSRTSLSILLKPAKGYVKFFSSLTGPSIAGTALIRQFALQTLI